MQPSKYEPGTLDRANQIYGFVDALLLDACPIDSGIHVGESLDNADPGVEICIPHPACVRTLQEKRNQYAANPCSRVGY